MSTFVYDSFIYLFFRISDNGISVHDMSQFNCPAIRTIERTKGANLFVLDIVVNVDMNEIRCSNPPILYFPYIED